MLNLIVVPGGKFSQAVYALAPPADAEMVRASMNDFIYKARTECAERAASGLPRFDRGDVTRLLEELGCMVLPDEVVLCSRWD
jgi:hypothetical protein